MITRVGINSDEAQFQDLQYNRVWERPDCKHNTQLDMNWFGYFLLFRIYKLQHILLKNALKY